MKFNQFSIFAALLIGVLFIASCTPGMETEGVVDDEY